MTICYNNYFIVMTDITNILKETPYEYELFRLLFDINEKWYDIGLSLQVRRNVLDDLKHIQRHDIEKFRAVIGNFLTSQPSPVSWEMVITAIEGPIVNDKEIADKIRQYLSTGINNKLLLLSNEVINY